MLSTIRRAGTLSLLLVPALLGAQERPDSAAPVLLPGVTVSVLRTPVEVTRAPYAVAVNGQREIQRARPGLGLDEALRAIPGVQVDNRYNYALGERISIRGFGARAQFGIRGVRLLVDGIPATFPDGQSALSHVDLAVIRRAEVVRGPASALYGASAGGVIQFETEAPPMATFRSQAGVVAGSDGLIKLNSTVGGRSDRVDYLAHLSRLRYGGYRDLGKAENAQFQGKIGYTGPRDRLQLVASAVRYDAENPGSLSAELLAQDRDQVFRVNREQQTGEQGRHGQLGLTWRRDAGGGEWEVMGYGISRDVDNPIPNAIVVLDRAAGGARAFFHSRPVTPLALRWSAGGSADLQSDDRRNFANQAGERGALRLDQDERVTNLAGAAQLVAEPLPRLTLLAGARYDWYRFSADDRLIDALNPDDSGSLTLDALSRSVGATYSVASWLNLYANAATSFETPTTTELANRPSGAGGFNPELKPQTAVSYELGGKGRLGEMAAWELAAYEADVQNGLVAFEVPQAPGRQFFRNSRGATHRGVEGALTLAPLRGVLLRGSYTHTDARFDAYQVGANDFAGNRVPGIAPHRTELSASYGLASGPFAAVEGRYASATPVDDANQFRSPAYFVADLRAGLERVRIGRVEMDPFAGVTNLLDRAYNTSVVVNAFGRRYFEPGPGRALYFGTEVRAARR